MKISSAASTTAHSASIQRVKHINASLKAEFNRDFYICHVKASVGYGSSVSLIFINTHAAPTEIEFIYGALLAFFTLACLP